MMQHDVSLPQCEWKLWNFQDLKIGCVILLLKKRRLKRSNICQSWGFPMIFWSGFKTNLFHGSVCPMVANYLIFSTASSFLEGKSDRQFLSVQDFNVFTGIVVETLHIKSQYNHKKNRKNSFSSFIQWCNPHLATLLRSQDI